MSEYERKPNESEKAVLIRFHEQFEEDCLNEFRHGIDAIEKTARPQIDDVLTVTENEFRTAAGLAKRFGNGMFDPWRRAPLIRMLALLGGDTLDFRSVDDGDSEEGASAESLVGKLLELGGMSNVEIRTWTVKNEC